MRLGRSRRLRSVPKNTGTTAQSLAVGALEPAGGAAGATERVVERVASSLSVPLAISSLLAPTLGGIGGGAGEPTGGGGGDDAEGAGGGDGEDARGDGEGAGAAGGAPTSGCAGATDRFMARDLRFCSAPGAGGGAEAVFGDGAIGRAGRTFGADPIGGPVSLAEVCRL